MHFFLLCPQSSRIEGGGCAPSGLLQLWESVALRNASVTSGTSETQLSQVFNNFLCIENGRVAWRRRRTWQCVSSARTTFFQSPACAITFSLPVPQVPSHTTSTTALHHTGLQHHCLWALTLYVCGVLCHLNFLKMPCPGTPSYFSSVTSSCGRYTISPMFQPHSKVWWNRREEKRPCCSLMGHTRTSLCWVNNKQK